MCQPPSQNPDRHNIALPMRLRFLQYCVPSTRQALTPLQKHPGSQTQLMSTFGAFLLLSATAWDGALSSSLEPTTSRFHGCLWCIPGNIAKAKTVTTSSYVFAFIGRR